MSDTDFAACRGLVSGRDARVQAPLLDPLSFAFWCVIGVAAVALSIAVRQYGIAIGGLAPAALFLGAMAAGGLMLRWCGHVRVGAFVEGVAQLKLTALVFGLLALALACTNLPYRDAELLAIDRALFPVDWLGISTFMTAKQPFAVLLSLAYVTIVFQGTALALVLAFGGKLRRLRVFILAWTIGLCFVLAIFPFVPATGFYLHAGIPPEAMPGVIDKIAWQHINHLQPMRDGILRDIHITRYSGVATFPSFHAAAAVLFAWGLYGIKMLRVPAFVLNGAMLISSMPVGGHYIIDIVAGIALAALSLSIAQRLGRRLGGPADEDMPSRPWPKMGRPFTVLAGRLVLTKG